MKLRNINACWVAYLVLGLMQAEAQNVGLGTNTPHPSALLDLSSNSRGLLVPRMSASARLNIANPAKGLMVFDSSYGSFMFHNGNAWTELDGAWVKDLPYLYNTKAPYVGIGTSTPGFSLHVVNNNSQDGGWAQGIMVENINETALAGEAGISFRNTTFSPGKQWTIGLNQSSPLAFSFGTTFAGGNTRMVIDTIGRVGMGTTAPESSAQLQVNSTSRGVIIPRMTSAQRNAVDSPALGLLVFDTDKRTIYMFEGAAWVPFAQQDPGFTPVTLRTIDTIPQEFLDIGNEAAIDGELAVTFSAKYSFNGMTNVGCVFVFKKNGGRWDYVQLLLPDNPKAEARFGSSLALSGNLLVVGSPYYDATLTDKGKVWYYEWDGTAFQFLDSLVISTGQADDYFGWSLALRGNMLAVGAPQENTNGADAGGIYVYTYNPATKRFGSRTRLSAPNAKAGDKLGYSVDIEGAYVVAGAPFHPFGTGTNKGIAHVWTGSGTSWGYQDSCTFASSSTAYERLGIYVSLSSTKLICSANYRLSDNYNPGSAVYFVRSGSQWVKTQEIRSDDTDNSSTVPLVITRGNWLVIGNSAEDHIGPHRGNVWVYALESGQWVRKRRIYNYAAVDAFPRWSDSLGFDGLNIVIGSYTYNNRTGALYFTTVTD